MAGSVRPKEASWRKYLEEDKERLLGEIHWNDSLFAACRSHGIIQKEEAEYLYAEKNQRVRGILFIKYLKGKKISDFGKFADVLEAESYSQLSSEMKSMIPKPNQRDDQIHSDIKSRVDMSLRDTRLSENKKDEVTRRVSGYVQTKAYQWEKHTSKLTKTLDQINVDIEDMCKRILREAKNYSGVSVPLHSSPSKMLDACVTQVSKTCAQLHADKEELLTEQENLTRFINEKIQQITSQKEKLEDTEKELEQLKKSDKSKADLIERLKLQLQLGKNKVQKNLENVEKLQHIQFEMKAQSVEVAGLNETINRKNEKIKQLEEKVEDLETQIDRLKGQLQVDPSFYK